MAAKKLAAGDSAPVAKKALSARQKANRVAKANAQIEKRITKDDKGDVATVSIPDIQTKVLEVTVKQRGDSTLIVNRFSEKAKREMLDKMQGAPTKPKTRREPEQEFERAKYNDGNGNADCIPAGWIRRAMIEAATYLGKGVSMKFLSGAVFIPEDFLPLKYKRCIMREDPVRNANGSADLRYRPEYHGWSVTFPLEFDSSIISVSQVMNLLNRAGFHVGIGEMRPQKKGDRGRFVVSSK